MVVMVVIIAVFLPYQEAKCGRTKECEEQNDRNVHELNFKLRVSVLEMSI